MSKRKLDHLGVSAFCESMGMMVRSGIATDEAISLLASGKEKGGVLTEGLSVMKEKAEGLLQDPAAGKILRIKGFHFENGCWHELNISGSATTVQVCSAGQEVFIVIGENLDRERIARHLEIGDEVWHNGNVYVGAGK